VERLSGALSWLLILGATALLLLPWATERLDVEVTGAAGAAATGSMAGDFTLAVSWQPAFCETARQRPECQSQTVDRFDAAHFSLHGLWPDPAGNVYCNVPDDQRERDRAGRWAELPALDLPDELRADLNRVMPGTRSNLHRHEWIKHGTCAGGDPVAYYDASLELLSALNGSAVQDLVSAGLGDLDAATIRAAFDRAFGQGAGQRVEIECVQDGERRLISELRISLSGEIGTTPDFSDLIAGAPPRDRGCPGGIIDPVGWQ